jgi:hypothetical protein
MPRGEFFAICLLQTVIRAATAPPTDYTKATQPRLTHCSGTPAMEKTPSTHLIVHAAATPPHAHAHTHTHTRRACISKLSADERTRVLPLLPRHTLEAVLGAFCCATASETSSQAYDSLSALVPDLDYQLHAAAVAAFPEMTAAAWHEVAVMAAGSVSIRHELSKSIEQAVAGSARRGLAF